MQVEDMTKETVSTHWFQGQEQSQWPGKHATNADRPGITQESAPTRKRAQAKARDSKENVTTAATIVIPQGSGPKAK